MKKNYSLLLLLLGFTLISSIETGTQNAKPFIVVLDAGHGGHDPGNLGNGYLEKNIALNIVLKVGSILGKEADVKIIYTRKDDTFIDLFERGEIANKANADLFVSVHCDSHSSDAHGAGTFVLGLHANKQNFEIAKKENSVIYLEDNYQDRYANYDINSPESVIGLTIMQEEFLDQSILLAKLMQDNFSKKLKRTDRKVKQAGFIVLHQTFMPSVLVETGFLTNKSEGSYLNSKKGQEDMGNAIAQAILKYKNELNSSPGSLNPEPTIVTSEDNKVKPVSKVAEIKEENEVIVETKTEVKKEEPVKKEIVALSSEPIKKEAAETTVAAVNKVVENKEEAKKEVSPIIFKVQIMASAKDIPLEAGNFKGLSELSKEPFKNLYRYMHGETNSFATAKTLKQRANEKGYTSSYIVSYKNGIRIPIKDALKYLSE